MQRVKFADDNTGSTNLYTVTLNPTTLSVPQAMKSELKNSVQTVDGESIVFEPYFDARRCQLIWQNIPTDFTGFSAQIQELDSYVGNSKYIDLGDIGDVLYVFDDWTYIKVVSLDKELKEGGRLVYSKVVLVFELAEE